MNWNSFVEIWRNMHIHRGYIIVITTVVFTLFSLLCLHFVQKMYTRKVCLYLNCFVRDFQPPQVVGRGSETQLQVGENFDGPERTRRTAKMRPTSCVRWHVPWRSEITKQIKFIVYPSDGATVNISKQISAMFAGGETLHFVTHCNT